MCTWSVVWWYEIKAHANIAIIYCIAGVLRWNMGTFLWWCLAWVCACVFLLRYWLYIRVLQHFIYICIIKLLFRSRDANLWNTVSMCACIFARTSIYSREICWLIVGIVRQYSCKWKFNVDKLDGKQSCSRRWSYHHANKHTHPSLFTQYPSNTTNDCALNYWESIDIDAIDFSCFFYFLSITLPV